jgi:hypothetical protein
VGLAATKKAIWSMSNANNTALPASIPSAKKCTDTQAVPDSWKNANKIFFGAKA